MMDRIPGNSGFRDKINGLRGALLPLRLPEDLVDEELGDLAEKVYAAERFDVLDRLRRVVRTIRDRKDVKQDANAQRAIGELLDKMSEF